MKALLLNGTFASAVGVFGRGLGECIVESQLEEIAISELPRCGVTTLVYRVRRCTFV